MSTIKTEITSVITLELTDGEAGALQAICGYDVSSFMTVFEKHMGHHYIAPYKEHMTSLFTKCRALHREVKKVEKYRAEFPKLIKI